MRSTSTPLVGTVLSETTVYHYDDPAHPGDVTTVTDPDGHSWQHDYDGAGNPDSTTDPAGNRTTSHYNGIGWMTATLYTGSDLSRGNCY